MLFVSAPTHALSHYDDIGFTHCGLCIHHHQMQACLPLSVTPLALSPQVCPQQEQPSVCVWRQHVNHFQGRAPPQLK
ncbi:ABC-type zinc uptake system zinc chaperone [Shewanella sp. NIFS-20-20]|uniref:ABC-type zinc uptake system zinc chaperone n=1 Tax=Shewanella sp. NIFS-20-20 TaxID=2853806 RepID=UPI001C46848D|nr:ABC-type zinc uptake system zinc chaperone [Shewanella sp. NIFS-20-20]MBV7316195.1 ABC-type zinc uptake system zinc chaperone [Shewanella sp. NIFS-20-20]